MFKYLSGESHAWKESKENLALGTSTKSLASVENEKRKKRGKKMFVFWLFRGLSSTPANQ